jgi:hypothetical protein
MDPRGNRGGKAEMLSTAPPFTFEQSQSYQLIHEKQPSITSKLRLLGLLPSGHIFNGKIGIVAYENATERLSPSI